MCNILHSIFIQNKNLKRNKRIFHKTKLFFERKSFKQEIKYIETIADASNF